MSSNREIVLLLALAGAAALFWYSRTSGGAAVVQSLTDSVAGAFVNRGVRNCNPGNIRRTNIRWQNSFADQASCEAAGRVWDNDFVVFYTMQDGERALGHQIATDLSRGQNTVRLMIAGDPSQGFYGYAPSSENDTETYIANVCEYLGVTDTDILDDSSRPQIAQAIMKQETGYIESDPNVLAQAVYS
jgi:hypothetical protein